MKILVVDDQKYVLNGIKKGIDFEQMGFSEVYFAYSAFEAKQIIKQKQIDILLCDIEMPYENGLSLLSWIRENEYQMECIFLTAHADFDYARQAVRLGSFEYILQPARYSDIISCLKRVIQKINRNREREKYYAYGKIMYTEKEKLAEIYVKSWFHNTDTVSVGQLLKYLADDKQDLNEKTGVYLIHMQLCGNYGESEWEDTLIMFSSLNILRELWGEEEADLKMYPIEKGQYLLFFLGKQEALYEAAMQELLVRFTQVAEKFLGFQLALYCGMLTEFAQMSSQAEKIKNMKNYYLNGQPGIYHEGEVKVDSGVYERLIPDKKRWENLLLQGYPECVLEEAMQCMDNAERENLLTPVFLKKLYQMYMEVLNFVFVKRNGSIKEVLQGEGYLNAYCSRSDMENLFHMSLSFFLQDIGFHEDDQKQVEKIKEYIYKNLEHDIRRDDIADAVYLSPGYVSRIFKRETNQSLKEFITEEKMKMARTLIQTTGLPISIIAVKVGYTNFSHFSQLYKKYYNVSPSEERRMEK